ncbi:MAG: TonB-dependent receptor [Paludibacteraceae bacterium]
MGVSVIEKGTSNGAVTNIEGHFNLKVASASSVLTISYIGMQTQNITIGSRRVFNISLEAAKTELDEVVVIGYGSVRKKDLTGSLSSLKSDELQKTKTTSFLEAMQGKMSGVQVTSSSGEPGSGVNITIRGGNSINAGTSPLYVIDGLQIDVNENEIANSSYTSRNTKSNPLAGINPSDIVSIEVLKDASVTAIYGSRGANGVIFITTKSGNEEKTKVELDIYSSLSGPNKYINVLQGQQYADYRFAANPNSEYGVTVDGVRQAIDFASLGEENHDWQREVLRNALTQSYNLSINSGGKSATRLSGSFGYFRQEGIVKKNVFERYNGRLKADWDINRKLTLGANMNLSHQKASGAATSSGGNSYNGLLQTMSLYRPYRVVDSGADAGDPNNGGLSNPLDFLNYSLKEVPTTRIMIDGYGQYKFTDELIFRASAGSMLLNSKSDEWYPSTTSWGYAPNGVAVLTRTDANSWQTSNTLTYAKSFKGGYYLNAMLGFEFSEYYYTNIYNRAEGFANQSYEGIYDVSQAGTYPDKITSYKEKQSRESEFGRLNFVIKDKYLFTATMRRDGSSKFGANNKYAYFPSAAFAWKANNERFLKKIKLLDELKLRLSFGATGNDRIPTYRSLSKMDKSYYTGISVNSGGVQSDVEVLGLAPAEISNPNLKWETTYQYNAGTDIKLFQERLSIGVDLYYKKTVDMLLHAEVPGQSGSFQQWQNLGRVDNKGIEITVGGTIIQTKDFQWNANLNFNMNRNKIISLGSVAYVPVNVVGGHITEVGRAIVGQPIGTGWGYVFDGIYQKEDFTDDTYTILKPGVTSISWQQVKPGDIKFKNLDGDAENTITPEGDKTVISNSQPLHYGGFSNSFSYRGFDATLFFQWSYGNEILNIGRYRYEGYIPYFNISETYWDNRWTENNPSNIYPRIPRSRYYRIFFLLRGRRLLPAFEKHRIGIQPASKAIEKNSGKQRSLLC